MTDRERRDAAITVGIGIVFGVGLHRWKGDGFRSNMQTQLAMQIGIAIGYFLVADRDSVSERGESE